MKGGRDLCLHRQQLHFYTADFQIRKALVSENIFLFNLHIFLKKEYFLLEKSMQRFKKKMTLNACIQKLIFTQPSWATHTRKSYNNKAFY